MGLASFNRMRRQNALKDLKIETNEEISNENIEEVKQEKKNYNDMSLLELKQIAKERKIERWSTRSKDTLVKLLTEGDENC